MTAMQHVLSPDEIRALLTEVTDEEFAEAKTHSLTKLKRQILFEGTPGGARHVYGFFDQREGLV